MKMLALTLLTATLAWSADATAGKAAYEKSCKRCHGADGAPVAAISKMMKVEMKHLGSKEVQGKSDAELAKEAKEGVGKMKPMTISEGDAANIVAFVRTLKQ